MPTDSASTPYPGARLTWSLWAIGATFYLLGYLHRVAPSVIAGELVADFALSAAGLGLLSASYFYAYLMLQVPTGLLVDTWGPRRILAAGALLTAAGTLMFAAAGGLPSLFIGRLLIGVGTSVTWVCMLKFSSHWMPPRQFSFASGMLLMAGVLGALTAGLPLRLLVEALGWRPALGTTALAALTLAFLVWKRMRDDPSEAGYHSHWMPLASAEDEALRRMLGLLRETARYRALWLLVAAGGGVLASVFAFAGLWGVPFFHMHYGMPVADAALTCSLLIVLFGASSPFWGWLADRTGRAGALYRGGTLATAAAWGVIAGVPGLPLGLLLPLLAVAAAGAGTIVLGYTLARDRVPRRLAATASGLVNMGSIAGPLLLQPLFGWVLDLLSSDAPPGNAPLFGRAAFHAGFALILGCALLSFACLTRFKRHLPAPSLAGP